MALRFPFGARRAPARAPSTDGRLIYAIGDVHGCSEILRRLLKLIESDVAKQASAERPPVLVFIGDYVDRGPDSRGVIDIVLSILSDGRFEVRALKGNHEQALLQFLAEASFGPTWARLGGMHTLASYGVAVPGPRSQAEAWAAAREDFGNAIPPPHTHFLETLELTVSYGDYVFVHAGVRPGVRLADQCEQDLLWIRDEFLRSSGPFGQVIVHGHTPEPDPFIGARRIGIDTGAYATGVLTAARLTDAGCAMLRSK